MITQREEAFAKINLTLDVLSLRPDGYHEVDMVMQSVSLADSLTITPRDETGLSLQTGCQDLPTDDGNLAIRAARCFLEAIGKEEQGLILELHKRIPVCAGTAGGSSDAAAVLRALNRMFGQPFSQQQLQRLGETIGSDVPYCVLGGTARAQGRGEVLTKLPSLPACWIVLCKPDFGISTPELFHRIDAQPGRVHPDTDGMLAALAAKDLTSIAQRLGNAFEAVLPEAARIEVQAIKNRLRDCGALGACMSGTGPTVFGIFSQEQAAREAVFALTQTYAEVFFTQPV